MSQKKVLILGLVALVLVGGAYLTSSNRRPKNPSLVGTQVLPNLDLTEVARLELGSGAEKMVLASAPTGWVVESLHNYPADVVKIRENLLRLQELKVGHVASDMQLQSPTLLDLHDSAGKSLATLLLGEKHMRQASAEMAQFGGGSYADGRYVSSGASGKVVLVGDALDSFDGQITSWVDTRIAEVPAAEVVAIELRQGEETLKLSKVEGAWTLAGLSEAEEFNTSQGYGVESALSYLNFTTLADPTLDEAAMGMTTGAVFSVSLKSGETYTAHLGATVPEGEERYLKLSASFKATGTNEVENATFTQKVADFNAKNEAWNYLISAHSAGNMLKQRADLVTPKAEPEEEAEEQPAADLNTTEEEK
ncbi:MAG: DUF4340 domain-containing protein [Desulfuromonadaceae bacterium]|nr:DUF4340 domain-containing protein [Desulfuromonadaceae bacterium]